MTKVLRGEGGYERMDNRFLRSRCQTKVPTGSAFLSGKRSREMQQDARKSEGWARDKRPVPTCLCLKAQSSRK